MQDIELLRALFDTAEDAILVFDSSTLRILDVNPRACEMYGYNEDEMVQLALLDLSAEPERSRTAVENGDVRIKRRLHRRKDGTVFPVEVAGNRLTLDGRTIEVGYIRDITEHEQAQRALAASEQKFAAAFRTSPDSVNLNRLSDGLYLDINEGFTRLTGYTADDVAGKTSEEIAIWADMADRERLVAGLRDHGEFTNLEAEFRCKDGSVRTGLMSARVIVIDDVPCILSVTRDISDRKAAEQELRKANAQLSSMLREVAEAIGRAVETRDPYTQGHQERVARVARLISIEMGLAEEDSDALEIAGLLHDVGKLGVPAEILNKPGTLSEVEHSLIRVHAQLGFEILKDIPFVQPVAQMILQHHERVDGSGYPQGLGGDDILLGARILAVADVVEATASHRPYRPARGLARAVEELIEESHRHDLDVVAACSRLYERGKLQLLDE